MPCGCAEVCTCYLIGSDTVAVSGSGTSGDPWVPVVVADPNGGLTTGVNGVAVLIDPASTLPWSLGPDGLLLDCCPAAVLDSETIDFDIVGGAVTGDVIPAPTGGLENTANGVAIEVDLSSTADVSTSGAGLKVDIDPATVLAEAWATGDYKYSADPTQTGWLVCDGTLVASAAYPTLDALIGSGGGFAFSGGVDPGGGNFALPDGRARFILAPGTHVDVDAVGDADAIALVSRRPSHSHTGPSHSHGPGTLAGVTAATTAAAALTPGAGTLQDLGVNDDIAGGEAWLNVTSAVLPASPATPTNNNSGDGEGPGSTGDIPLSDHKHGIASVAVSVTGGTTAAAGTGATSTNPVPYLVAGYLLIKT